MSYIDTLDQDTVNTVLHEHGETLCQRHNVEDERFALWLHMADRAMTKRVGIGINDVEDYTWRDEYDAGTSPVQAVLNGLAYMGMWDE